MSGSMTSAMKWSSKMWWPARPEHSPATPGPMTSREAVVVRRDDAEFLLDGVAHALGPRLRAEAADADLQLVLEAHLYRRLAEVERIGRRADEDRHAEVGHELELPLGKAARRRDKRRADALDAVVEAEAAGEKPVAERDLDRVVGRDARRGQKPRDELGPCLEVLLGVAYHGGLAGRAGRAVDAHDVALGDREEAEGVLLAEVVLGGEGDLFEVVDALDVAGGQAGALEAIAIEGDALVDALDDFAEPLALEVLERASRHGLELRVPDCHADSLTRFSSAGIRPAARCALCRVRDIRPRGTGAYAWKMSIFWRILTPAAWRVLTASCSLSNRKTSAARPVERSTNAYMYSTLRPALTRSLQYAGEAARAVVDLDGDDEVGHHREAGGLERVVGHLGLVDDEPEDAELARVRDGERDDVDVVCGEDVGDVGHAPDLVLQEYRYLRHLHLTAPSYRRLFLPCPCFARWSWARRA